MPMQGKKNRAGKRDQVQFKNKLLLMPNIKKWKSTLMNNYDLITIKVLNPAIFSFVNYSFQNFCQWRGLGLFTKSLTICLIESFNLFQELEISSLSEILKR